MLKAALRRENVFVDGVFTAGDRESELIEAFQEANNTSEVIICTGGVSVGDHDLVARVLKQLGATIHFHGVAQKPGKPMLFATWERTAIFGLPGNPRAVMVLFWEYVLPFLRAMQGARDPWLKNDRLPLAHALSVKGERSEFRAAKVEGGKVMLLADEGSHMLRTLVDADALAYIPSHQRVINAGDDVEIHYLPR
jgi:molybdopterin molybdotransferase